MNKEKPSSRVPVPTVRGDLPAQEEHNNSSLGFVLPVLSDCFAPQEAGLAMTLSSELLNF